MWEVLICILSFLSPTLLILPYCLYVVLVWYICYNWWIYNGALLSIHFIVCSHNHFYLFIYFCADTCVPCIPCSIVTLWASHLLPYPWFLETIDQLCVWFCQSQVYFFVAIFCIYKICIWYIIIFLQSL